MDGKIKVTQIEVDDKLLACLVKEYVNKVFNVAYPMSADFKLLEIDNGYTKFIFGVDDD
jgi:hypothetical protein